MSRERHYAWYACPMDDHTNKALAGLPDVEFAGSVLCEDGQRREMWEVGRAVVSSLQRSRSSLSLSFGIFVREGGRNAPARPWKFDRRSKRPGTKKARPK